MVLSDVVKSPMYPWMRDRVFKAITARGSSKGYSGGVTSTRQFNAGLRQRTIDDASRGKTWASRAAIQKNRDMVLDLGGPFYSERYTIGQPSCRNFYSETRSGGGSIMYSQQGWLYPNATTANIAEQLTDTNFPSIPGYAGMDLDVLRAWGSKGIARAIPTVPEVSIAQTLGELREGLPSLVGLKFMRDRTPRGMASEYLNYQFGISPLISDISKYLKVARDAERIKAQLKRDSGRLIRRRQTLVNDQTVTVTKYPNVYPGNGGTAYTIGTGTLTLTEKLVTKVWFSGAFQYSIGSQAYAWLDKLAEFNRVYGALPNAKTAWELLPWSWLVDWFSNAGDIITNVSYLGRDGLWMPYGYVMGHTISIRNYTWTGVDNRNRTWSTSVDLTVEVKQRIRAHPLGFGITGTSLTAKQAAILAALGISRGSVQHNG